MQISAEGRGTGGQEATQEVVREFLEYHGALLGSVVVVGVGVLLLASSIMEADEAVEAECPCTIRPRSEQKGRESEGNDILLLIAHPPASRHLI